MHLVKHQKTCETNFFIHSFSTLEKIVNYK